MTTTTRVPQMELSPEEMEQLDAYIELLELQTKRKLLEKAQLHLEMDAPGHAEFCVRSYVMLSTKKLPGAIPAAR